MKTISYEDFFSLLDKVKFPKFDLLVAIGSGGIIPAGFIQQRLNIPMKIIWINYRDEKNTPRHDDAKLLEEEKFNIKNKKILIIDDVSRTGKTLAKAKEFLSGNKISTFVINGKADYNLFDCEECILMPWKRQ
jgi:uncharacterized protein